jgi:hypothetical protein
VVYSSPLMLRVFSPIGESTLILGNNSTRRFPNHPNIPLHSYRE